MPGLVAGLQIDDLALEAAPLGPAQIHAQQHLGPVLRLGAAGARMDRDDRVLAIVLAAEHLLGLAGVDLCRELVERPAEIVGDRLPGFGPLDEHGEIVDAGAQATCSDRDPLRAGGGAAAASARRPDPSRNRGRRRVLLFWRVRSSGRAASKIAPQVAGAARQILVPAKLVIQLEGQTSTPMQRLTRYACQIGNAVT